MSAVLVPSNGAGVSGLGVSTCPARAESRAARRQRGPWRPITISSNSSHASAADCVRAFGSFTSSASTQSEIALVHRRVDRLHRRDLLVDVPQQDRHRRVRVVERHAPREHLEGHAADGVEVGPRPDVLRHRLLGRHVGGGADRRPRRGEERARLHLVRRLGDAEVGDLHAPVDRDHQVLGLEVAVHDPVLLRVGEARRAGPRARRPICSSDMCPTYGRSEPRSTYSIAMYGVPSCSK